MLSVCYNLVVVAVMFLLLQHQPIGFPVREQTNIDGEQKMNAPLSLAARHAMSAAMLPMGFLDEDDNPIRVIDQWHQSHLDAKLSGAMPKRAQPATDFGRQAAAAALALCRAAKPKNAPLTNRQAGHLKGWRDTPREYRQVLVRMANLTSDVVDMADRDLSENVKVLLRAAAKDLSAGVGAVVTGL